MLCPSNRIAAAVAAFLGILANLGVALPSRAETPTLKLKVLIADSVPVVDVTKSCRIEAAQGIHVLAEIDTCIRDQKDAREVLVAEWQHFATNDKAVCVSMATKGYLPSYIELLTCLEMFEALKVPPAAVVLGQNGQTHQSRSSGAGSLPPRKHRVAIGDPGE